MPYFKLIARARPPLRPFADREVCAELWSRLQERFDKVLACVLMPNHLHLDLDCSDPEWAHSLLVRELVALTRSRFQRQKVWDPIPRPELIQDSLHLKRHIRYVHLNPCRAGFAQDPLEWEWSTHRDAVGAVGISWMDLAAAHRIFKVSAAEFPRVFHSYVSGDPTVSVAGTSLPKNIALERLVAALPSIEEAVYQATRGKAGSVRQKGSSSRRIAARLAHQLGGRNQEVLGDWLGLTRRGLWDILNAPASVDEKRAMLAATLILSQPERFRVALPNQLPKMRS